MVDVILVVVSMRCFVALKLKPVTQLTFDVDPNCQRHVILPHGAEQGAEVHKPIDSLRDHDLLQIFKVQDVCKNERSWKKNNNNVKDNISTILSYLAPGANGHRLKRD